MAALSPLTLNVLKNKIIQDLLLTPLYMQLNTYDVNNNDGDDRIYLYTTITRV